MYLHSLELTGGCPIIKNKKNNYCCYYITLQCYEIIWYYLIIKTNTVIYILLYQIWHNFNALTQSSPYGCPYGYAWVTLWVRHVISLRAPLQNITRLHPSFQLVLSRGIRGERHGHNDSTERNITTLDRSQSDKQKGKSFHGLGEAKHFKRKKRKKKKNLLRKTFAPTN